MFFHSLKWDNNFPAVLLLGNTPRLESGHRLQDEQFEPKPQDLLAFEYGIIIFQAKSSPGGLR
jgi:hypothetical protein